LKEEQMQVHKNERAKDPVLIKAPSHESIEGSEGKAPNIVILGKIW
jgi:hypothetical protein